MTYELGPSILWSITLGLQPVALGLWLWPWLWTCHWHSYLHMTYVSVYFHVFISQSSWVLRLDHSHCAMMWQPSDVHPSQVDAQGLHTSLPAGGAPHTLPPPWVPWTQIQGASGLRGILNHTFSYPILETTCLPLCVDVLGHEYVCLFVCVVCILERTDALI